MHHIAQINISRVMMLFCFPIWLWQEALCVDRRDAYALRRISLLRSLTSNQPGNHSHACVIPCYFSSGYPLYKRCFMGRIAGGLGIKRERFLHQFIYFRTVKFVCTLRYMGTHSIHLKAKAMTPTSSYNWAIHVSCHFTQNEARSSAILQRMPHGSIATVKEYRIWV